MHRRLSSLGISILALSIGLASVGHAADPPAAPGAKPSSPPAGASPNAAPTTAPKGPMPAAPAAKPAAPAIAPWKAPSAGPPSKGPPNAAPSNAAPSNAAAPKGAGAAPAASPQGPSASPPSPTEAPKTAPEPSPEAASSEAPKPEAPKPAPPEPPKAPAAAPSAAAKAEAGERFNRGLALFEAGNLNAALVEFERAYDVVPHPTVLFNIGLVNAALDRPVDAQRALAKLVAAPGNLSTDRMIRAKDTLAEVEKRIGTIELATLSGAQVELDGVVVGTTPLSEPLRVATGTRVVGVLAPGHAPVRKSVAVTSGQTAKLALDPPVIEGRLAHLAVRTGLPGASLFVDGELVAKTPLPTTLTFLPGMHELVLRREGYRDAKTRIALGEGATGEIDLEPEEDTVFVQTHGGDLELTLSEPSTTITVDGKVRGAYVTPLRLSPGLHRLLVECAGFRPLERDVFITEGKKTSLDLTLEPTPEKRVQHAEEANDMRLVGIVTGSVGLAVIGGSAGFLGWNAGNKADQQAVFDDLFNRCIEGTESPEVCETLTEREDSVNQALSLDIVGAVGIGLGAATLATGITIFLMAEDPEKYETTPSETLGNLTLLPVVQAGPNGAFFGVGGHYR